VIGITAIPPLLLNVTSKSLLLRQTESSPTGIRMLVNKTDELPDRVNESIYENLNQYYVLGR
jgi:hypothetical protein